MLDGAGQPVSAMRMVGEGRQRAELIAALRDNAGNVSRTSTQLGLSRQAVYRLMEKFEVADERNQ